MKRFLTIAGWLVAGVVAGIALYFLLVLILAVVGLYSYSANTAFVLGLIVSVIAAVALRLRRTNTRSVGVWSFLAGIIAFYAVTSAQVLILQPHTVWPLS